MKNEYIVKDYGFEGETKEPTLHYCYDTPIGNKENSVWWWISEAKNNKRLISIYKAECVLDLS